MNYIKPVLFFFLVSAGTIVRGQQTPLKPKTAAYYEYEDRNAFRGIKFGSRYLDIKDMLKLESDFSSNVFKIKNPLYLSFNGIPFKRGQAYFTPVSRKLYQIVLYQEDFYPKCSYFNLLKNSLTNLFGTKDAEYSSMDSNNFKTVRNSWYGEVQISISVEPYFGTKKAEVSIMVQNSTYNNLSQREAERKSQPDVPKI